MKYHDQREIILRALLTLLFVLKEIQIKLVLFQIPRTQRILQIQANSIFSPDKGQEYQCKDKPCPAERSRILENSSRQCDAFSGQEQYDFYCFFTYQVRVEYTYSAVLMQWLVKALVTNDIKKRGGGGTLLDTHSCERKKKQLPVIVSLWGFR